MQNAPRLPEWLKSLADPVLRGALRIYINSALSDFLYSADGLMHDPLDLPAYSFGLDCYLWFTSTQTTLPWLTFQQFLHGATIWAGLLRILAGRVTVTGVDTSCVTSELVASTLERFLQAGDLNLGTVVDGRGLIPLVSQPLHSVPAMSRYNVRTSIVGGGSANNRIFVDRPGEGSRSERPQQTDT
jgi:hypothetical protein